MPFVPCCDLLSISASILHHFGSGIYFEGGSWEYCARLHKCLAIHVFFSIELHLFGNHPQIFREDKLCFISFQSSIYVNEFVSFYIQGRNAFSLAMVVSGNFGKFQSHKVSVSQVVLCKCQMKEDYRKERPRLMEAILVDQKRRSLAITTSPHHCVQDKAETTPQIFLLSHLLDQDYPRSICVQSHRCHPCNSAVALSTFQVHPIM